MLETEQKAPEFTLPDQNGHDISLTSLLKDGPAILFFYPADFTPGCTREACSIRDLHRRSAAPGLTVAGISPQSPDSHRRFREKYNLPFTLLSDETKEVIKMFGVNGLFGVWVQRVDLPDRPEPQSSRDASRRTSRSPSTKPSSARGRRPSSCRTLTGLVLHSQDGGACRWSAR